MEKKHRTYKTGPIDGKGQFVWVEGYKYPYPGNPTEGVVGQNDIVKRKIMVEIRSIIKSPSKWKTLFTEDGRKNLLYWLNAIGWDAFKGYFPPDNIQYCRSGRELLRCTGSETLAMMWEFDNSYRFRGQDVLGNFNRENYQKNKRKEIIRLFKLGLSRELAASKEVFDVRDKWIIAIWGLRILLRFSPLKQDVYSFFDKLNPEEIKLDPGDWYWCCERRDYNFGGLPYHTRVYQRAKEDMEWKYFPYIPK